MKYTYTILVVLLISITSYSQGFYNINYTMSMAVGETGEYISSPSFRGLSFEGGEFISDNVSIGGVITWSVFFEKSTNESFTEDNMTITGTQYRYLNVFPILFQAHYYINSDDDKPSVYMGGGAGAYRMVKRTSLGIWQSEQNSWHFGISPEVGILIPLGISTDLNIGMKYHYVIKTSETTDFSWFGLNVGIALGR